MASPFGYKAKHCSMSKAIRDILFDQIGESNATVVTAPDVLCRMQLGDSGVEPVNLGRSLVRESPPTPIELLAYALPT